MNRATVSYGTTRRACAVAVHEERRKREQRNNLKKRKLNISKFKENYKFIEPRSSIDSKYRKNQENYTKAHHKRLLKTNNRKY